MPIYEYKCEKGHVFEVMQRMADDPVVTCETCEAPVERVFHPIAVHFKGSGFYNTDYGTKKRSREKQEHDKSSAKAKSDGSSGSDSKSSTATASKTDSKSSESKSSSSNSSSGD